MTQKHADELRQRAREAMAWSQKLEKKSAKLIRARKILIEFATMLTDKADKIEGGK